MVGRAPHEAERDAGPRLHRLAAQQHLLVVARHLPRPVDAAVGAVGNEGHQLEVFRPRLEIVERGRRAHRVAERRMRGHVRDPLAVEIDRAAVAQ